MILLVDEEEEEAHGLMLWSLSLSLPLPFAPKKFPDLGLLPRTGDRGPGLLARGPGLLSRGPGLLDLGAGLLDRAHGPGLLPPVCSPPRGGLLVKPTPRAGGGPTAPATGFFLGEEGESSLSLLEPKKDPLKGLRRGDCREVVVLVWPSLSSSFFGVRLLRIGDRSGDWRLLMVFCQGDGGGVAFGVQICSSDFTWRWQWGHLPDMKVLPPTVEYLCN